MRIQIISFGPRANKQTRKTQGEDVRIIVSHFGASIRLMWTDPSYTRKHKDRLVLLGSWRDQPGRDHGDVSWIP